MPGIPLSLLAASMLVIIILLRLLKRKKTELDDITRLYANTAGAAGFDTVISILTDEITNRGLRVIRFYRKNRISGMLESDGDRIPLLEKSSAVKAFFTLEPCKLGDRLEADKGLVERLGADTVFIPVHMKKESSCWRLNGCAHRGCAAHGRDNCICWVQSGKAYRGKEMKTHNEKLAKCFSCKSFLSIGVFAVQGRKIGKVHAFINDHFSGALRNSVIYERALYSASMDPLTDVCNRRGLERHLSDAFKLAEKYGHPLSVCILDIDHFKRFNDTYGHRAGDLLLRELAGIVTVLVREVDIVARYGGEEFCIVFPHTVKGSASEIAERIRAEVEAHVFSGGRRITISLGLAGYPEDDAAGPGSLVKKADIALYRSKITRNAVTVYSPEYSDPTR